VAPAALRRRSRLPPTEGEFDQAQAIVPELQFARDDVAGCRQTQATKRFAVKLLFREALERGRSMRRLPIAELTLDRLDQGIALGWFQPNQRGFPAE
jgi:hypothetical protein